MGGSRKIPDGWKRPVSILLIVFKFDMMEKLCFAAKMISAILVSETYLIADLMKFGGHPNVLKYAGNWRNRGGVTNSHYAANAIGAKLRLLRLMKSEGKHNRRLEVCPL